MNIKGKGPNLTWIFIGLAIALVTLTLSFSLIGTFLSDNNATIDDDFAGSGSNFTSIHDEIDSLGSADGGLADQGLLKSIWVASSGTVNVFVMGLSAISKFFAMIPIIGKVFSVMESVVPEFNALFGLLSLIITVYISMSILKAKRGTSENA